MRLLSLVIGRKSPDLGTRQNLVIMGLLILSYIITGFFIMLWAYASFPKFGNMRYFKEVLQSQAIPRWIVSPLTWLLPLTEIAVIVLLLLPETRLIGMYFSLILMIVFTIYVGGIIYQVYDKYPCPCGGLFSRLGWKKHFKVNIMITLIALIGVVLLEHGSK